MATEERIDPAALSERVQEAYEFLHIDRSRKRLVELDHDIAQPGFWDDPAKAQQISKEAADLRSLTEDYAKAEQLAQDVADAAELSSEDPAFADEERRLAGQLEQMLDDFEVQSWFSGRFDGEDAIVTIHPGAGGLEAQDWCEMLFTMYRRYANRKDWKVRVLDAVPGEEIGLDRASVEIMGKNAYGMLRSEIGVHRLVRISPTDEKKRRHTTFASVEVLPVLPDDIEVDLNPADVRVDVYRASGPGGQCVNTTDSAVRLTHIPTGIVVTCQNQKSQLQNKEAAFRVLRGKLYELEERKRQEEISKLRGEKMDNSFGSQIRNYVLYPYQLVKDLRSGVETSDVDGVLDGDIDRFVVGYHRWKASQE
jgi:peptide chain release factor 2